MRFISGSPTKSLAKDHFVQFCILGWIASFDNINVKCLYVIKIISIFADKKLGLKTLIK